ncbi:MAG: hypothetical protein IJU02_05380, partial [Lachnospiraceae bacterium]|nr:hypothetical protein [Lachnospiraceae bacterium]
MKNKVFKKNTKRVLSVFLCVILVVPMLALSGCEKNYEQLDKEKVPFDKSGEYSISFGEDDMLEILEDGNLQETRADMPIDFKDIVQEDVKVSYDYIDDDVIGDESSELQNIDIIPKTAQITNFVNDGNKITISFKDEANFANNAEDCYLVVVEKAKRAVIIEPQIPDNTLSSNTKEVSSEATENTIVITSKEGKFSSQITPADVSLDYSFRDMKVESVEPDGKKLTVKLSGSPVIIPELSTVYTAGEIEIAPSGFEKAVNPEEITFEIKVPLVAVDTEGITGGNGTYNVPINVSGVDVSKINANDIDFGKNTQVKGITKKNGQIIAEVEAENMDELGGHIKIGDYEYLSGYSHASVAPFPLAYNLEGDNFVIDLFIIANNGKISSNIDKSQIVLHDDFEGGNIVSLNEEEDKDITIRIEVPSNGASLEDMNLTGTLEFVEGALKEDWGDDAPAYFVSAQYNKDLFQVVNATGMNSAVTGKIDQSVLASIFGNIVYAAEPENNNNNNNNENNNNN